MRIPFVTKTESRDGTSDKDARLTNALISGDKVVSRPGLTQLSDIADADGKGLVAFNGKVISCFGQTVYVKGTEWEATRQANTGLPADHTNGFLLVYRASNFVIAKSRDSSFPGIYKTTDGYTFTTLNATPGFTSVRRNGIIWDGNKFVAHTGSAIWNSSDGATWTNVIVSLSASGLSAMSANHGGLVADTATTTTYYVAPYNSTTYAIHKSTNSGATWSFVATVDMPYTGSSPWRSLQDGWMVFAKKRIFFTGIVKNNDDMIPFVYEINPATGAVVRKVRFPNDAPYQAQTDFLVYRERGLFTLNDEVYFAFYTLDASELFWNTLKIYKLNGARTGWQFVAEVDAFSIGTVTDAGDNVCITGDGSNIVPIGNGLMVLPPTADPAATPNVNQNTSLITVGSPSSVGSVSGEFFDFVESAT